MRLLERVRIFRPAPPPAPRTAATVALSDAPELEDADLEHVVGGLERVYVPAPGGY